MTRAEFYSRMQINSQATKVMLRLDGQFRRRGLRSYRGYAQHGERYARLNFDNQIIEVGTFGDLRRLAVVC